MDAPYGISIFCDDIREEAGGKLTLVGCYGHDIQFTVPAFPIVLPKLGVYIISRLPLDQPIQPIRLFMYFPGDPQETPSFTADVPTEHLPPPDPEAIRKLEGLFPDASPSRMFRQHFVLSPVIFKEEGYVRIRMLYGDERIRLGSLKVHTIPATVPDAPKAQ